MFSFFLIVLTFNFVQACTGTFALGLVGNCNASFYLGYIAFFSAVSYLAACVLVAAYERSGKNDSGRRNKARR